MVQVIQELIPRGRNNRPGYKLNAEYITIHDTANTARSANAASHANYLKTDAAAKIPASWHFTVDDTYVYQHLPTNEVGWHAGDGANGSGNRKSIGIEICENAGGDRKAAEINAAKLTAQLMLSEGIPITKVVQHNHWSGKNCPHTFRTKGTWKQFIALVQKEFDNLTNVPEDNPSDESFKDVPENHWASESIKKAKKNGVIKGFSDGSFGLGQAVTREELCVILDRLGMLE